MKWWKGAIAGALFLGAAAITAGGLKDRPPPSLEVQLSKARKGSITRTITGAGKVQAATTVKISSSLSGDLVELAVKDGEAVTKGQVLGRIDPRLYQAAHKQALASLNASRADVQVAEVEVGRAQLELARVEDLAKKGLSSAAEVDTARATKNTGMRGWRPPSRCWPATWPSWTRRRRTSRARRWSRPSTATSSSCRVKWVSVFVARTCPRTW